MLSSVCERMAREAYVDVLARDRSRLDRLAARDPEHIYPLACDYRNVAALISMLRSRQRYRRAVCWVHEEVAPEAPMIIADQVEQSFWHVLGSASADPAHPQILQSWRDRFRDRRPALDYRQVILGFVMEGGRSRWLADKEICDGIWGALQNDAKLTVVGTISPWSQRP
jgi:hypothetical protein